MVHLKPDPWTPLSSQIRPILCGGLRLKGAPPARWARLGCALALCVTISCRPRAPEADDTPLPTAASGTAGQPPSEVAVITPPGGMEPDPLHIKGRIVDCPLLSTAPLGSTWYAIDDHERWSRGRLCQRGTSRSEIELILDPPDDQFCAIGWSGSVTTDYAHGFAAMGVNVEPDLSSHRSIVLRVRGDGRKYRAQFPMHDQLERALEDDCESGDFDFYGQVFQCGDGSTKWHTVRLDLRRLKQEGWGTPWKLDLARVNRFQVTTLDRPIEAFRCDIEVKKVL